jgi:hypothetical protein
MRIKGGTYKGASLFAYFDKPTTEMSLVECRKLLDHILQRAMPSEDPDGRIFRSLEIAEQNYKEEFSLI